MTDSTLDPVLRSRLIEEGARGILRYWKFPAVIVPDAETVLLSDDSEVCRLAAAVVDALGIEEYGTTWDVTPDTPERAYPVYRIAAAEDPLA